MNNCKPKPDELFDIARRQDPLLSQEDIEGLINSGVQSPGFLQRMNFRTLTGARNMNIIIASVASIAIASALTLSYMMPGNNANENVVITNTINTTTDQMPANNNDNKTTETTTIIKNDQNDNDNNTSDQIPANTRNVFVSIKTISTNSNNTDNLDNDTDKLINVRGVNIVNLEDNELRDLGISTDDDLQFYDVSTSDPIKCNFKSDGECTFQYLQPKEIKSIALPKASPRLVTDLSGKRYFAVIKDSGGTNSYAKIFGTSGMVLCQDSKNPFVTTVVPQNKYMSTICTMANTNNSNSDNKKVMVNVVAFNNDQDKSNMSQFGNDITTNNNNAINFTSNGNMVKTIYMTDDGDSKDKCTTILATGDTIIRFNGSDYYEVKVSPNAIIIPNLDNLADSFACTEREFIRKSNLYKNLDLYCDSSKKHDRFNLPLVPKISLMPDSVFKNSFKMNPNILKFNKKLNLFGNMDMESENKTRELEKNARKLDKQARELERQMSKDKQNKLLSDDQINSIREKADSLRNQADALREQADSLREKAMNFDLNNFNVDSLFKFDTTFFFNFENDSSFNYDFKFPEMSDSINIRFDNFDNKIQIRIDSILNNNFINNFPLDKFDGIESRVNSIDQNIDNYIRINKLIPIYVPVRNSGNSNSLNPTDKNSCSDFGYILWYELTPELVRLLPERIQNRLEPEIATLSTISNICNAPIKDEQAYLDVWRSCSGAIENLSVFPNPAKDKVSLRYTLNDDRNVSISIHNLTGRSIRTVSDSRFLAKGDHSEQLDLQDLEPGIYLIVAMTNKQEQAVQRLIIER
jgi:hypothetical protein